MKNFEMVRYGKWTYPSDVPIRISEIAAHFDKSDIYPKEAYSLHTEYSFGARKFSSRHLADLENINSCNYIGIPQLWKNAEWASDFAKFVFSICEGKGAPEVIEIHPPFSDYVSFSQFVEIYKRFEDSAREKYPNVRIMIENRCGSNYKSAPFLFSKAIDFVELCENIERYQLDLKIAFDIPQLFTAEKIGSGKLNRMSVLFENLKIIREYVGSVHLWGKADANGRSRVAHHGNFDTYFRNTELKAEFLALLSDYFDDNAVRYMVLEVNSSNDDVTSIINDLKSIDFRFI